MELVEFGKLVSGLIVAFAAGGALIYFKGYLKEASKSKALLENVKKLESEKQRIITAHQIEIENLKKEHQLEIEKKKHQYESKKTQYFQFMNEIDEFNGCLARVIYEDVSGIMLKFYEHENGVSDSPREDLTIQFNKKAQEAIANVNAQESKLFSRLNPLKLSANHEVVDILEELMNEIKKSGKNLIEILGYVGSESFFQSRNAPERILSISDSNQNNLAKVKEKLILALKRDLDKI